MPAKVNKWIVAITVMLPTLMVILDTSVVNVSLDHIRGGLSAGIDEATWSITSYLAANAIIIPMTGWLSRFFGRKRYLIFSVSLFTLSSLFCGFAWNIQSLVFFRVLQGLAGGSLQPMSQSILLETFPPHQHGTAMAIFGVGIMFGPIMGPVLGGWITDNWTWRWIFYINIPIGIISILMFLSFIRDPDYMKRTKLKIDYWGLVLLAVGIGCLQMILDRGRRVDWFSSEFIIWLSVISAISLILFIIVEIFAEYPIVNLRAFKNYSFSLGNVINFFVLFTLYGSIVLLPIYLQTLMGYTATLAGIVLAPGGIASLVAMPIAGVLITRINSKYIIAVGVIVTAYANILMSMFNRMADFNAVILPRIFMGIGVGLIIVPLFTLTLSHIRKEDMANATSIFNLVRNLGGSFGVAITTTILTRRSQFHQSRLVDHLTPFDMNYIWGSQQTTQILQNRGLEQTLAHKGGLGVIYETLLNEAYMMSFNDVFYIMAVMIVLMLPLVFFMKHIRYSISDRH
ncbi:MAG: DHA2 family efflux MFS transporter permease subunit [Thermodesulfobacteriota bacterium]|nr:DHA2 family efflux MFS transporter permease subunit [Thermodesulfobacteriota bacterium]